MELSKTTKEVIMQAQTLQMEAEGGTLCQEHLFYGLLLMASYLDEPMNDSEYRAEAKALRKYLSGKMRSISAARDQVRRDALDGGDDFVDARPSLGRAVEIAGEQKTSLHKADLIALFEKSGGVESDRMLLS